MLLQSLYPYEQYKVYEIFHKRENRYYVCLVPTVRGLKRTTIARAKFLYETHHKIKLEQHQDVSHKDRNKLNDVVDNLQVLSYDEHAKYDRTGKLFVKLECPICHVIFEKEKRQTFLIQKNKRFSCCSRDCGYIAMRSHSIKEHFKTNSQVIIEEFNKIV